MVAANLTRDMLASARKCWTENRNKLKKQQRVQSYPMSQHWCSRGKEVCAAYCRGKEVEETLMEASTRQGTVHYLTLGLQCGCTRAGEFNMIGPRISKTRLDTPGLRIRSGSKLASEWSTWELPIWPSFHELWLLNFLICLCAHVALPACYICLV